MCTELQRRVRDFKAVYPIKQVRIIESSCIDQLIQN